MSTPREIEIKLAVPPEQFEAVAAHPALQGEAPPVVQQLHSVYFDTPGLDLAEAGLGLRVRSTPQGFVQTLKSRGTGSGVASVRGEWEWPVAAATAEIALLATTPAAALPDAVLAALVPVASTTVERSLRLLRHEGAVIEVALDRGSARGGDNETPLCELELELKSGPPIALTLLAIALQTELPLRLSTDPKIAVAFRLRTGLPPEARESTAQGVAPGIPAAAALRQLVDAGLGDLLGNQTAAEAGVVAGVHQMRVATRRLRSTLLLFGPLLEPLAASRFGDALRELGRALGDARDWDVFCEEMLPTLLGMEEAVWRPALEAVAGRRRAAAHDRLHTVLAGRDVTALALGLTAWAGDAAAFRRSRSARTVLDDLAPVLLDGLHARVRKRGSRIAKRDDEGLHALRKAMKKLRYGAEALAAGHDEAEVAAFLKRCRRLQKTLGTLNDAVTAHHLVETLAAEAGPELLAATGALAGAAAAQRRKALASLPERWKAFKTATPFW